MSQATVKFRLEFPTPGRRSTLQVKVLERKPRAPCRSATPERLARRLALAHCIERMVERSEFADYAQAARALGVSRARMSQVMDLLLLPPGVQDQVLLGDFRGGERRLRGMVVEAFANETNVDVL